MKTSSAIDAVAASSLKFIKIGDGTNADVGIRGGVDVGAGIVVDVSDIRSVTAVMIVRVRTIFTMMIFIEI